MRVEITYYREGTEDSAEGVTLATQSKMYWGDKLVSSSVVHGTNYMRIEISETEFDRLDALPKNGMFGAVDDKGMEKIKAQAQESRERNMSIMKEVHMDVLANKDLTHAQKMNILLTRKVHRASVNAMLNPKAAT